MPRDPRSAPPLDWAVARSTAYAAGTPVRALRLALTDCAGGTLAEPLVARTALPPWDLAAMDGYAVAGPGPWRLVGEVLAGDAAEDRLLPGQAVATATGARLPDGTTAVLQVEHAERREGLVHGDAVDGRHVRRAAEECAAGEQLLPSGTPVTGAVLGLAAASGHDDLLVRSPVEVAALVTGDELLEEGLPRAGRVRDALGPLLPTLVAAYGGRLTSTTHLRDDADLLTKALDTADGQVVVVTGASSAGPADHLRPALLALGAELLVDGVACRPGAPQLLARLADGRIVVGLPGNPLAALAAAATVLGPLLAGLTGRVLPRSVALLAEPLSAVPDRTRLVPVRREGLHARPVPSAGSGMLLGAALADALAVVPPGADLARGAEVELLPLP